MKKIILIVFLFFSVRGFSQKVMVADETYFTLSTSSSKITTANDSIVKLIIRDLKNDIYDYGWKKKKENRYGYYYYEYYFTFKNIYYNDVVNFINKLK